MDLLDALSNSIANAANHIDDDWVDRLNRMWSVGIFIIFTIVISTKQYVGDPIECWCPAYFNSNYLSYADKICWISNTYYVPIDDRIPDEDELKPHLTYYQWTPFILLFQACMFYLPCLFWQSLNDKSGLSIANMISACKEYQRATKTDDKEKTIKYITKHLDRHLDIRGRKQVEHRCKRICCCRRQGGAYLALLYLATKAMYCINAVGQLFLLDVFLGSDYHMYGYVVLKKFVKGEDWSESPQFPRITLCDFKIRQVGNLHRHTVQCVLPVNLFNEKIFVFVWFWLALTALFTCMSMVAWLWRTLFPLDRLRYVKHRLSTITDSYHDHKPLIKTFVHKHLKEDGVFILRLISKNTSDIVAADILVSMWEQHLNCKYRISNGNKGEVDCNIEVENLYRDESGEPALVPDVQGQTEPFLRPRGLRASPSAPSFNLAF